VIWKTNIVPEYVVVLIVSGYKIFTSVIPPAFQVRRKLPSSIGWAFLQTVMIGDVPSFLRNEFNQSNRIYAIAAGTVDKNSQLREDDWVQCRHQHQCL